MNNEFVANILGKISKSNRSHAVEHLRHILQVSLSKMMDDLPKVLNLN